MSREEAKQIAEQAADRAVYQLFRALGVDISNQQDLNDLRNDLVYSRRLRRLTESSTAKFWFVAVSFISVGIITLFWNAIKQTLGIGEQ